MRLLLFPCLRSLTRRTTTTSPSLTISSTPPFTSSPHTPSPELYPSPNHIYASPTYTSPITRSHAAPSISSSPSTGTGNTTRHVVLPIGQKIPKWRESPGTASSSSSSGSVYPGTGTGMDQGNGYGYGNMYTGTLHSIHLISLISDLTT